MEWKAVRETATYKKAGLMERHSIRKAYFDDFIKPRPDFPKDQETGAEIESIFTSGFKEKLPPVEKPKKEPSIWEKKGESELEYRAKRGAWGAAYALANTLETASFGLTKGLGLKPEPVGEILKEGYGADEQALQGTKTWGDVGGYAIMFPVLFELGGGAATIDLLTKAGARPFLARAVGWGLTGFESGSLRELVSQGYKMAEGKEVDKVEALKSIGIKGAEEAAFFAAFELGLAGVGFGGKAFLKTRPGRATLSAMQKLGKKSGKVFDYIAKQWKLKTNPTYKRIARAAKAEGKTYDQKMVEIKTALETEKNRLKTSYEISKGRTWEGDVEFPSPEPSTKTVEVLDSLGRPARETVAEGKPGFMRTAEDRLALQKRGIGREPVVSSKVELAAKAKPTAKPTKAPEGMDTKEFGFTGQGLKEIVVDMPLEDIPKRSITTPEYRDEQVVAKAGRKVTKPIIAAVEDVNDPNSPIEIVDGWHRWQQAVANKDKTIKVKLIYEPTKAPKVISSLELESKPILADRVLKNPEGHPPEVRARAKLVKGQPVAETSRKPIDKVEIPQVTVYEPKAFYNVSYRTPKGVVETMMTGNQLNGIESTIKAGKLASDGSGLDVLKIIDTHPVSGSSGATCIFDFETAITNIAGTAEAISSDFKHTAKNFGAPFFVGQKYPSFKPVYMAVQDAVDYKAELFFEGARILNPRKLAKLPVSSQAKLTDVIRLGNSRDVQRWYNPEELKANFHMNDSEIKAYNAIRRVYKYATDMEIKARKALGGYENMSPAQKKIADEQIAKRVERLGGYVSQTRLGGEWAVYAPPEAEGMPARFFNLYQSKAEARKAAELLGGDAKVYLRRNLHRDVYQHITLADLENLREAADVSARSADMEALTDVIRKRTFSAHWIQRKDIPGYEWTWTNLLESSVDYLEGSANKLSRITGRQAAEKAFGANVKSMTPELREYSRNFINGYYNQGAVGYRALNRLLYSYKLAFKLSWLGQNLTQPIATTYPVLAGYYKGGGAEKVFITSYDQARRYALHRMKGDSHGLSTELVYSLNKLHRQGTLGDQLTRFQLGVKTVGKENFEQWVGLFGRAGEGVNRTHAAISGYRVATDVVGLKDKDAILEFMREFVYKTQFAYGKHNLPPVITGGGTGRNVLRTMYTFKHYIVNYMQLLNSMMPWRGAPMRQTLRATGALLGQAGIKGLPFAGIVGLAYKKIIGRTLDHDLREAMEEHGVPEKGIDMALHGGYSVAGVDASNLVGAGDVIPTYGSLLENIGGAAVGFGRQLSTAVWYASRGDYKRALEYASPDAIRNVMKGMRYAREGVRKASGELIAMPSTYDSTLQGMGFTPIKISKAWEAREAKKTILERSKDKSSDFHQKIAWAVYNKDKEGHKRAVQELIDYNKKVQPSKRVKYNKATVKLWMKKMQGMDTTVPRKLRREFKDIEETFGVEKGRR